MVFLSHFSVSYKKKPAAIKLMNSLNIDLLSTVCSSPREKRDLEERNKGSGWWYLENEINRHREQNFKKMLAYTLFS